MIDLLQSKFGDFISVESLRGVAGSKSSTSRLQFAGGCAVVKSSSHNRERLFYERYANALREHGVHVPQLYWAGIDSDHTNWIAMEYIPGVFPQEQWRNNPAQIRMLCNLHAYCSGPISLRDDATWYRPKWDDEMTELAFTWFEGSSEGELIKQRLRDAQQKSQTLFVPHCCLSGDPNPTNWRVRSNGELVMVDWERFCEGNPAIDLAITMPNLGTEDLSLETQLARTYNRLYREMNNAAFQSDLDFALQIRAAKIWTVVEFIANAARDMDNYPKATIDYIVAHLPAFIPKLS
ncbi:aminoglycoside phosphotransferase family protein [Alicyclobacillus acidiphilus]|uniref:aminoglycoside phosphotransferase family protein n=1 Tax=Alicyclobacillus acidiphilus TaxID=182455 RepID=UPI00351DDBA1